MGCDWNRAFCGDFKDPPALPAEDAVRVAACELVPCEGYKTWKNVVLNGRVLGMVRVRLGGWSECKRFDGDDAVYCGDAAKLNQKDDRYSLAVLTLRELTGV